MTHYDDYSDICTTEGTTRSRNEPGDLGVLGDFIALIITCVSIQIATVKLFQFFVNHVYLSLAIGNVVYIVACAIHCARMVSVGCRVDSTKRLFSEFEAVLKEQGSLSPDDSINYRNRFIARNDIDDIEDDNTTKKRDTMTLATPLLASSIRDGRTYRVSGKLPLIFFTSKKAKHAYMSVIYDGDIYNGNATVPKRIVRYYLDKLPVYAGYFYTFNITFDDETEVEIKTTSCRLVPKLLEVLEASNAKKL